MQYHGVGSSIPQVERPGLVLSAEQELGITAGLQDRVIQVGGGQSQSGGWRGAIARAKPLNHRWRLKNK